MSAPADASFLPRSPPPPHTRAQAYFRRLYTKVGDANIWDCEMYIYSWFRTWGGWREQRGIPDEMQIAAEFGHDPVKPLAASPTAAGRLARQKSAPGGGEATIAEEEGSREEGGRKEKHHGRHASRKGAAAVGLEEVAGAALAAAERKAKAKDPARRHHRKERAAEEDKARRAARKAQRAEDVKHLEAQLAHIEEEDGSRKARLSVAALSSADGSRSAAAAPDASVAADLAAVAAAAGEKAKVRWKIAGKKILLKADSVVLRGDAASAAAAAAAGGETFGSPHSAFVSGGEGTSSGPSVALSEPEAAAAAAKLGSTTAAAAAAAGDSAVSADGVVVVLPSAKSAPALPPDDDGSPKKDEKEAGAPPPVRTRTTPKSPHKAGSNVAGTPVSPPPSARAAGVPQSAKAGGLGARQKSLRASGDGGSRRPGGDGGGSRRPAAAASGLLSGGLSERAPPRKGPSTRGSLDAARSNLLSAADGGASPLATGPSGILRQRSTPAAGSSFNSGLPRSRSGFGAAGVSGGSPRNNHSKLVVLGDPNDEEEAEVNEQYESQLEDGRAMRNKLVFALVTVPVMWCAGVEQGGGSREGVALPGMRPRARDSACVVLEASERIHTPRSLPSFPCRAILVWFTFVCVPRSFNLQSCFLSPPSLPRYQQICSSSDARAPLSSPHVPTTSATESSCTICLARTSRRPSPPAGWSAWASSRLCSGRTL